MLIFLEYLKSKDVKNKVIGSIIITVILISIIYFLAYFTEISSDSDFDISMIKPKTIDFNYVFLSNFKLILLNLLLGLITFGIFPIFSVFQNVYTLGIISNAIVKNGKEFLLLRIVPHGILEIFILSLSLIILFSIWVNAFLLIKNIILKNSIGYYVKKLYQNLVFDIFIVFILLIVAGIVEYFASIYL